MCDRYDDTTPEAAMRSLFAPLEDRRGNVGAGEVYPDRMAPILTREGAGYVLRAARWGLPSPPQYHSPSGIDRGVTNVRNTASIHWRRWLGPAHRCLVPMTRFGERRPGKGAGHAWFALAGDAPGFFAGLWVPGWTSIRKLRDGATTDDLFAFLTCPPNGIVAPIHPKAMPVILTDPAEMAVWLSAPWAEAQTLQRPLPDELLIEVE